MLELLFKRPTADFETYHVVATLRVSQDGTHTIEGEDAAELLEIPILTADGQIIFKDQPAEWVRNAHLAFRTPYLITELQGDEHARG